MSTNTNTNTNTISEFNDIVLSLLLQLSTNIGIGYVTKFKSIITCNSVLPIERFLIYALPHRDKILQRDESYFTENDNYYKDLKDDDNKLNEILRLKNIYNILDNNSKKNIWNIFQAMLYLGDEYIKYRVKKKKI
jgi:hypothetical protein